MEHLKCYARERILKLTRSFACHLHFLVAADIHKRNLNYCNDHFRLLMKRFTDACRTAFYETFIKIDTVTYYLLVTESLLHKIPFNFSTSTVTCVLNQLHQEVFCIKLIRLNH